MANALTNDGEQLALEMFLGGRAAPATYEMGLTDAVLTAASNLADATADEPSGSGYSRVTMEQDLVTGWPTSAIDSGHWQLTGKNVVFSAAGGDITPFRNVFLTDGSILVAFWNTVAIEVLDGNSFTFVPKAKMTSA